MALQPIENHGIIGDLSTVALVGMDGTIDFLCWPRFDSPSVFAALLDPERGGHFRIAPMLDDERTRQIYLPETNVLYTRFLSEQGLGEVADFMPLERPSVPNLVRVAKTIRGEVEYQIDVAPRFDYGRAGHVARVAPDGSVVLASRGGDGTALRLRASIPLQIADGDVHARVRLRAGEAAWFVLEDASLAQDSPALTPSYIDVALDRTVTYWRRWVARSNYQGRWREVVHRSALCLKLLTSAEHGSMVAAATFGLPEHLGGNRNWDYRYTWIRDTSFTLSSLMRIGYEQEAGAFMKWLEARLGELEPDGSLRVLYGIDGRRIEHEDVLAHFGGYGGSRPVRIGNGAAGQLQLDIYGELLDAIHHYDLYGEPVSHAIWREVRRLVDWVCRNWEMPDEGIWEVRGGKKEFLLSRAMCWVAIDRALRIAHRRSLPAPLELWYGERDRIYDTVHGEFWSDERRSFVQHRGSAALDASAFLLPLMNFIGPTDPRWLSTLAALETDLVDDSLVFRYRPDRAAPDGLGSEEGTFCMCSFWYVDCLAKAGRVDAARFLFEKMLGYANHLGLYPEELGPRGEHLGNFPQAFTHLALIRAARMLDRALSAAGRHE